MRILTVLVMTALLCGAVSAQEQKKGEDAWKTRVFTAEELKKYNGKDGLPVYVAADGIVYDLSRSKYWKTGRHMKMHDAGSDLSKDLHERAPKSIHRDGKILGKMPKVGVLQGYVKPATDAEVKPEEKKPVVAVHKVAPGELGREAACPVTGQKLTVAEGTPALDLKGKTYYFSDDVSLDKFKQNPGKYLGGLKDKAKGLLKKKKG